MGASDVSIRELRNSTREVIERIEAGGVVYLTKHGRRIAEIRPLHGSARRDVQALLDEVDEMPIGDSGAWDELLRSKIDERDAETRRDSG